MLGASTLTLPSLRDGSLPLPLRGRGANTSVAVGSAQQIRDRASIALHRGDVVGDSAVLDAFVVVATVDVVEGDVRDAGGFPGRELLAPGCLVADGGDPDADAERLGIAACVGGEAAELREGGVGLGAAIVGQHDPAVAVLGDALERAIVVAAEPERHAP